MKLSDRGAEQFGESDKASHHDLGAGIHWGHIDWPRLAERGTLLMLALVEGSMRVFAPESEIASTDSGTFGWAFAWLPESPWSRLPEWLG